MFHSYFKSSFDLIIKPQGIIKLSEIIKMPIWSSPRFDFRLILAEV